jgi:hypothetical protein
MNDLFAKQPAFLRSLLTLSRSLLVAGALCGGLAVLAIAQQGVLPSRAPASPMAQDLQGLDLPPSVLAAPSSQDVDNPGTVIVRYYKSGPWKGGKAVIECARDQAYAEIRIYDQDGNMVRIYSRKAEMRRRELARRAQEPPVITEAPQPETKETAPVAPAPKVVVPTPPPPPAGTSTSRHQKPSAATKVALAPVSIPMISAVGVAPSNLSPSRASSSASNVQQGPSPASTTPVAPPATVGAVVGGHSVSVPPEPVLSENASGSGVAENPSAAAQLISSAGAIPSSSRKRKRSQLEGSSYRTSSEPSPSEEDQIRIAAAAAKQIEAQQGIASDAWAPEAVSVPLPEVEATPPPTPVVKVAVAKRPATRPLSEEEQIQNAVQLAKKTQLASDAWSPSAVAVKPEKEKDLSFLDRIRPPPAKPKIKRDVGNPEAGVLPVSSFERFEGPMYGRHREFERRVIYTANRRSPVKGYDFYVDEVNRKEEFHNLYYYKFDKNKKPRLIAVEKHDHVTFLSNYDVDVFKEGKGKITTY